jgi:hypothetical protein
MTLHVGGKLTASVTTRSPCAAIAELNKKSIETLATFKSPFDELHCVGSPVSSSLYLLARLLQNINHYR